MQTLSIVVLVVFVSVARILAQQWDESTQEEEQTPG